MPLLLQKPGRILGPQDLVLSEFALWSRVLRTLNADQGPSLVCQYRKKALVRQEERGLETPSMALKKVLYIPIPAFVWANKDAGN